MTLLDGAMASLATTLTQQFGRPVDYVRPATTRAYNPATGANVSNDSDLHTEASVVYDNSRLRMFPETLIENGDKVAIIATSSVPDRAPRNGEDYLVDGGVRWTVVEATPYSSGALDAAWALLVRR